MPVAVLSDIHGNRHAFEAVLEDVRSRGIAELWCLGDIVGYGADPAACVALAREHADLCLAGNHDLAVTGELSLDEFSRGAALAARWTQEVLGEEELGFLRGLSPQGRAGDVGLFHASPRDPVWEYVLSALLADLCLDATDAPVSLVGHSHVALAFARRDGELASGSQARAGEVADLTGARFLLNPGSVGQPRDGDPRAAWLLLDTDAASAAWQRTEYDIAGAQAAIRAAGLPDSLAERLGYGQ
jgi:diadenosine tetraphosphatase ApaH/serine/threonine PP2A family protein phosphatase